MKFRAAVGSLLVGVVAAGAGVMPATGQAGGSSGPLCEVTVSPVWYYTAPNFDYPYGVFYWPDQFRRHEAHGGGWAYGHSTGTYPTDFWVRSSDIDCTP